MGFIKALVDATGSSLADQWKEYFYCDSMENNILICKGKNQQSKALYNSNTENNIISNGSVIAVNEGQCAIIVEDGKIIDIICEPGRFIYEVSTESSIFAGEFGDSLKESFKQIGRRFTFGGNSGKDQRVYYINAKLIENNLFGTYTPLPFRFVDNNIGADFDLHVRCRGRFSYQILNPIVFYTKIAANVIDTYASEQLLEQLRAEFINCLQAALAHISKKGIRPSDLLNETTLLVEEMNKLLENKWLETRGIKLISIAFESISVPEEEQSMLTKLQQTKVFTNINMANANLAEAQADALRLAAKNEKTGSFMAFAGLNMANSAGNSFRELQNQKVNNSNSFEERLKKLEMLKGKIPEELYNEKMEELLSDI